MSDVAIRSAAISHDFGPVRVLFDVDIAFERAEVHAVIGENGAGKSTLMKILAGYLTPSEGTILVDEKPVHLKSGNDGEDLGVVLIHQEFNLVPHLTVAENIFLGKEELKGPFLNKQRMNEESREVLSRLHTDIAPDRPLYTLSMAQWQMVEIAKALSRQAHILIMDEPTAVLTPNETEVLFEQIRNLQRSGVTVLYISHKLDEVKRISDRVTVLRDGRLIETRATQDTSEQMMANLMVGRKIQDMYPPKVLSPEAAPVLSVRGLSVPGWAEDVSFDLHRGEILGFAGLVGAGRTEIMEAIISVRDRSGGEIWVNGTKQNIHSYQDAAKLGIVYLSEDRKGKGVITSFGSVPNLTLMSLRQFCHPLLDQRQEQKTFTEEARRFEIKYNDPYAAVATLSGGNQQKLALAKIMQIQPHIIILDEPTRGIDIGTKREIYFLISRLAEAGNACIMISSELPEVIGVAHRVVVMRSGTVTGILDHDKLTEREIVHYATGVKQKGDTNRDTER